MTPRQRIERLRRYINPQCTDPDIAALLALLDEWEKALHTQCTCWAVGECAACKALALLDLDSA